MQASLFATEPYLVTQLLPFDEEPNAFRRVFELQVQHMFLLCPMRLIVRRAGGDCPWLLRKEYRHHVVSVCRTLRHKRVRPAVHHFVRLSRGGSHHLWQSTVSNLVDVEEESLLSRLHRFLFDEWQGRIEEVDIVSTECQWLIGDANNTGTMICSCSCR